MPLGKVLKMCQGLFYYLAVALQGLANRNAKTEEYPGPRDIECECVSPRALKLSGSCCREEGVRIHWDLSQTG